MSFWLAPKPALAELGLENVSAVEHPWASIGRVNTPAGSCTGVLIGPAQVLTAAHCAYIPRTGRYSTPDSLHVLFGYERGEYRVHARVRAYRLAAGYQPNRPGTVDAADWAVLDLAEDVPPEVRPLPLAQTLPPKLAPAMTGGYARGRRHLMTADLACRVVEASERFLTTDCGGMQGYSGGPLLGLLEGVPTVLGIVVAGPAVRSGRAAEGAIALPAASILRMMPAAVPPPAGFAGRADGRGAAATP